MFVSNRLNFTSIDELLDHAQGWDTDFNVLTPSKRNEQIFQLVSDDFMIVEVNFSCQVIQSGLAPLGYQSFAILADDCPGIKWKGQAVGQNALIIKPRTDQFDALSPAGFHVYILSIKASLLDDHFIQYGEQDLDVLLGREGGVVQLPYEHARSFRQWLKEFVQASCYSISTVLHLQNRVLALLNQCLFSDKLIHPPFMYSRRQQLARKSLDIFMQHPQGCSLALIRRELGISQRSLEYVFHDVYGLTPAKMMKRLLMNKVQHDLRNSGDHEAVADITGQYGFNHAGQFSKDYFQLFGERPHETLNIKKPG
ncbi:MAG: AraC family transcriptional regulator [Pseudomonadales bacterium]|nr:AraC family transcriptional regulator [Pseudomonadales bacterium]